MLAAISYPIALHLAYAVKRRSDARAAKWKEQRAAIIAEQTGYYKDLADGAGQENVMNREPESAAEGQPAAQSEE